MMSTREPLFSAGAEASAPVGAPAGAPGDSINHLRTAQRRPAPNPAKRIPSRNARRITVPKGLLEVRPMRMERRKAPAAKAEAVFQDSLMNSLTGQPLP
jgi:hypothetical protein